MSKQTYPFNTCETPNKKGISQPYSVLCNIINCIIIFYFLLKTKQNYTFILLISILCFELCHVFSHSIHIQGYIQTYIAHFLTYLMNLAFFYVFYCYTKKIPSYAFVFYLILLIFSDIYSVLYLDLTYYILSQSAIFVSLLLYYFPLLPKGLQMSVYQIIFVVGIIILLAFNEKYNCEKMLAIYPDFPYHIFIEIMGIVLFYLICSHFYKL
jgi:hypothetical protein